LSIDLGPEWQTFASRLSRTPQQLERDIRRTLTASLQMIERDARANAPQDTRRLHSSINHQITGSFPRLLGEVGPSVRYGMAVEFGRAPGRMPPVNALIGWVRRHWSPDRSRPVAAGRRRYGAWQRAGESALRSQAFLLARAIARRGVQAQPFMGPAFRTNRVRIESLFARIGVRTTAYLAGRPIT
jgi:hypothetical protein